MSSSPPLSITRCVILNTLIPLAFALVVPQFCIILPYIVVERNGQFSETFNQLSVLQVIQNAWGSVDWFNTNYWLLVIGIFLWSWTLLCILPGRMYFGPPTSSGYQPQMCSNGRAYYLLSLAIAMPIIWHHSMLQCYSQLTTLAGILIVFSFVLSLVVYIKGLLTPDPGDHHSTGNHIYDFCWGTELYPQLNGGIHLKILIFYRFVLLLWQLTVLASLKAHYEFYNGNLKWPIIISAIVSTLTIARINHLEEGYTTSLDNTTERVGFYYLCGCITGVPTIFTFTTLYYVKNSPVLLTNNFLGFLLLLVGLVSVLLGHNADLQRHRIRQTEGQCTIWGRKPNLIYAKWTTETGNQQVSLLLASGWWGIVRHPNYTFEILIYLSQALPVLNFTPVPYVFPAILTIILIFRVGRDSEKCATKYGKYWERYCELVPYKLVPGVF